MDKSIFDKYIAEMKAMKAAAMPNEEISEVKETATPVVAVNSASNNDNMMGMGNLIVSVTAVRGLYPVQNAKVTVFTGEGENEVIITEQLTDRSGRTPIIPLPAPSIRFTEEPNPSERPYAFYNVRTVADGYTDTENYNVAVFDKITSLQNVSLVPTSSTPSQNSPIIIDEFENYEL